MRRAADGDRSAAVERARVQDAHPAVQIRLEEPQNDPHPAARCFGGGLRQEGLRARACQSPRSQFRTPPFPQLFNDFLRCCLNRDNLGRPTAKELLTHPFLRDEVNSASPRHEQYSKLEQFHSHRIKTFGVHNLDPALDGMGMLGESPRGMLGAANTQKYDSTKMLFQQVV